MWIYFMEQVWCYDPDEWQRLSWVTHEYQARFWDHWHYHKRPDGKYASNNMVVYPQRHMVHGEDYTDL